jgi:hypothetical protein
MTEKFANHIGYSDINPYEIVKVISDKTLEVRPMDCQRDTSVKMNFEIGGFSCFCSNIQDQKWFIKSDPEARVIRIRKRKDGFFYYKSFRFTLSDKPRKFYDYNF